MEPNSGKNNWVGVVIIFVVLIGIFFVVSGEKRGSVANVPPPVSSKGMGDVAIFKSGLAAAGITADTIGFHGFSPDGNYFFLSAFTDGVTPANQAYLVKLADGTLTKLPGLAEQAIVDARVIHLYNEKGITLYWLRTGQSATYAVGENIFGGSLSPDGKTYVVNMFDGIRKIDIASGTVSTVTNSRYDGAYAWFADSDRMLGFKETDEALTDGAGKARVVGTWTLSSGAFAPLETPIDAKTFRSVEWVVPQKVARITAGFDDGSHDYLLNVETNEIVDIGDTSGSLMGGVRTDSAKGLFAVVGGDDQSTMGSKVVIYKGMIKKYELTLPKGYFREQMQIVSENELIYLRKQWGSTELTSQALVILDLTNGTETVLQELPPKSFAALSLSPDKKTWVLSNGAIFMTGALK